MIKSHGELLEEFIYSTILQDNVLSEKLNNLCSDGFKEKIDLTKMGIFNYLELFIKNVVCKDEYYKRLFDSIDDNKIEKIKIHFNNYLSEITGKNYNTI